jgi:hypothetical protein
VLRRRGNYLLKRMYVRSLLSKWIKSLNRDLAIVRSLHLNESIHVLEQKEKQGQEKIK